MIYKEPLLCLSTAISSRIYLKALFMNGALKENKVDVLPATIFSDNDLLGDLSYHLYQTALNGTRYNIESTIHKNLAL